MAKAPAKTTKAVKAKVRRPRSSACIPKSASCAR